MNRLLLIGMLFLPAFGWASTYLYVVDCGARADGENFCVQGLDDRDPREEISPSAIVHPPGYDGTQTAHTVSVCVSSAGDSELLIPATMRAVALWNGLTPTTDNCTYCTLPEDSSTGGQPYMAESAILHELGHCALGLGHPNLQFDDPDDEIDGRVFTSFANSYDGAQIGIDEGLDGVRGSSDDDHRDILNQIATNVTWAREVDNDPFVIDGAAIDINSYTRTIGNLQVGSWAANSNTCVAELLGRGTTKGVMNTPYGPLEGFLGLAADDVNAVKMGMAGLNRIAGDGDDYTLTIEYVEDCENADVEVSFADLGNDPDSPLAGCATNVFPTEDPPYPPIILHYSVERSVIPGFVQLNSNDVWILGPPNSVVFADGFETADTSEWSETFPALVWNEERGETTTTYTCPAIP